MDRFRGSDNYEITRFKYMRDIIRGLAVAKAEQSFPTAIREKLYENTLRHLVGAISDHGEGAAPIGGTTPRSCHMERCSRRRNRKDVLKEIHSLLIRLQRERLYDPPGEDEIGYYLIMKRYIRSIITFFASGPEIGMVYVEDCDDDKFECYTPVYHMHHMEELSELNKHLADLSVFVSEADIRNGSSVTPLMGINEKKIQVPALITGSKERSNAFYHDKFHLALLDLRSTEFAHSPPSEEEKRFYVQLLDDLALPSSVAVEGENFSDLLCCHFIERVEREVMDLDRHCKRIKDLILENLFLTERYESILEQFKLDTKDRYGMYYAEIDSGGTDLADFKRKLAQTCGVPAKELPDYVRCVDQYQRIAFNVAVFIISRLSGNICICDCFFNLLESGFYTEEIGWDFLHALTLLKQGRFLFGTVLREHSIAQISKKRARVEFEKEDKWLQKCGSRKEKNENLKILTGIIEDLIYVGGLDVRIDEEEEQLLHKIWQNVASSVQCFISAIAYEQRHHIVKCGGLRDARIPGLRTTRRKRPTSAQDVLHKLPELADEVSNLSFILAALRDGLREKAGKDGDLW